MRRRDFISLVSAATASAALGKFPIQSNAQQTLPDPAVWLRSGPMLGHSELTETEVWLQTNKPCRAEVRYWKRGKPEAARLSDAVDTNEASDFIARFKLSRLTFGTRYEYEIYLDGLRVPLAANPSFQSQAMWRWRTDPPPCRIAIGSCAYINDADYDRPVKSGDQPYGGGYEIFQSIARQRPDAMLWLGDNVYYREADWLNETAMRYRYAHGRALPEMRELLASSHHYAIWDDHDFGPNDSDRAYRAPERALRVFKDYWANSSYGLPETPGIFSRFEWNDLEFFLLDDRYHRSPNRAPNDPKKVMFGDAQMRWLMDALVSSNAPFKIIAGGNQMMNPLTPFEAFGNFPEEQRRLIDFIREARVPGVLFLSGDRHHTELIKRIEPGLYPLYDFTSSPLTSTAEQPRKEEENNPARVPGTWVTGVRNFGLIEASGPAKQRKLVLRTLDATGKEWWRHEIAAADLTFPK
jgi:alkaline phosphatase D